MACEPREKVASDVSMSIRHRVRNESFEAQNQISTEKERDAEAILIVCSELKRRLKAEQKAKEKAEKEEAKALVAAIHENQITSSKKDKIKEEDISPNVNIKELCKLENLYIVNLYHRIVLRNFLSLQI